MSVSIFWRLSKKIGKDDFTDIQSLEYVGIYESIRSKAWKSKSIKNIDFANKPGNSLFNFLIHLKT